MLATSAGVSRSELTATGTPWAWPALASGRGLCAEAPSARGW
jgi:hypothetical protein